MGRQILVVFALCVVGNVADAQEVDRKRHDTIDAAIEADKNHFLGKSLDEVSKQLDLDKVPWDKGYNSAGETRIYHFPGFYMQVHLRLLPPGITPDNKKSYSFTDAELKKNGVRWLASFYPSVHIDNLHDPKERMSRYWKAVGEGFKEKARLGRELEEKRRQAK